MADKITITLNINNITSSKSTVDGVKIIKINSLNTTQINQELADLGIEGSLESITEIIIPSTIMDTNGIPYLVTEIKSGLLAKCTNLISITIPFVGRYRRRTWIGGVSGQEYSFYDLFGTNTSKIPSTLAEVHITDETIFPEYAFRNCESITDLYLPTTLTRSCRYAFLNCVNLKNIYYSGTLKEYVAINFEDISSNPLMGHINTYTSNELPDEFGANLYIKDIDTENSYHLLEAISMEDLSGIDSVGAHAFAGCISLTEVELPKVSEIDAYAFSYCKNLSSLTFNSHITKLDNYAFYNCINLDLSAIMLNDELIDVQVDVFTNCDESKMTVVENNYYIASTSNPVAYLHKCLAFTEASENTCLSVAAGTLNPEVRIIGCNSLKDNRYLTEVNLQGSNVKGIGGRAFQGCSELTTITLHEDLLSSGFYTVAGCDNLRTIYLTVDDNNQLHDGLTSWLNFAPDACGNLFPNYNYSSDRFTLNSLIKLKAKSGTILSSNDLPSFIDISNNIKKIKPYAFAAFSWMTSVHIPSSIDAIAEGAFLINASSYRVTTYNSSSFDTQNLERIYIDSVEHWCSVTLPYEWLLDYFGKNSESAYAYSNPLWTGGSRDPSDTYAYIKDLYIYDYEDRNNSQPLSDISFPETISMIPDGRFNYCRTIKSIKFPTKLEHIGDLAFACCINLEDIKIAYPDIEDKKNVYFGISSFYGCNKVLNVYFDGTIEDWLTKMTFEYRKYGYNHYESNPLKGAQYFYLANCTSVPDKSDMLEYKQLIDLVIPETITEIPNFAFAGFTGFSSITIPKSVKTIGYGAFINCRFNALYICSKFFDVTDTTYNLTYLSGTYDTGARYEDFKDSFYLGTGYVRNCYEVHFEPEYLQQSIEKQQQIAKYAHDVLNDTPEVLCEQSTKLENRDNFVFRTQENDEEILVGYYGQSRDVICPSRPDLYQIGKACFYKNKSITSIRFNNNVYSIQSNAFYGCTMLSSIVFDNSLKKLDSHCFYSCKKISGTVEIPGSIEVIGESAFAECSAITSMIFNTGVKIIKAGCLIKCENLNKIYLPASLKESCNDAFSGCTKLEDVYYSGSISTWCNNITFQSQKSNPLAINSKGVKFYLKEITHQYKEVTHLILPEDVEELSSYIFYFCTGFKQLTILGQLRYIAETAFSHREYYGYPDIKFTSVYINDIKGWCQTYLPTAAANPLNGASLYVKDTNSDNYTLATKIELPLYTQEIRSYIFYGCKSIKTITLNPYLEFIGENALNSASLKTIQYNGTINQWLELKLPYAIINSTSPPDIKVLKDGAYSNIEDIDLTNYNITHIYRGTFEYSKTLTSITFPKTLKSLDAYAFRGCKNLNYIKFTGNELKVLPNYVFSETALDSFDIPYGVETVGYYSLNTDAYLKSITLPKSVKNIGDIGATPGQTDEHPFNLYIDDLAHFLSLPAGGSGLVGIFRYHLCGKYVSLYLKNASDGYDEIESLQIPESISQLSSYSIVGNNIKEVLIPESVSFIADDAFGFNLTNLTSLTLPESLNYDRSLDVVDSKFNLPEPDFSNPDAAQIYTIKDGCAYIKSKNNNCFYLYKADTSITDEIKIDSNTRYIGAQAFADCKVTKVIIPDSVIDIGYEAFKNCINLSRIQLPNSPPDVNLSIDGSAFIKAGSQLTTTKYANGCYLGNDDNPYLMLLSVDTLTIGVDNEITIGDEVINLPKNTIRVHKDTQYLSAALFGSETQNIIFEAERLKIKHIPWQMLRSYTVYKIFTLDDAGFLSIPTSYNSTSAAASWSLYVGNDISSATLVTELRIPQGIKRLNCMFKRYNTYSSGPRLKSIYLPHSLKNLYESDLWPYSDSHNIDVYYNGTLEDWCNLEKHGSWAYRDISLHLKHNINDDNYYSIADQDIIEIKNTEEVKQYSFYNVKIKSEAQIKFDNTLKRIGKNSFSYAPIKSIIFGDNLEYIGESAFQGCSNISALTFPSNLKTISMDAFRLCSKLINLTILGPTHIMNRAFSECSKLRNINLGQNTQSIGTDAFSTATCKHINIPASCLKLSSNVFNSNVTSINIDSREILIHPKAFSSSVEQIGINHDTLIYDGNWGAYNAKVLYKDSPEYFSQGFEFKAINDEEEAFEIIGIGSCVDTYLLIPPKYRQRPVITIKDSAFANNTKIKGFKLNSKNLNIEANAFKNCSNLDYVNCSKLDPCILDSTALSGCNLTDLRIEVPKNALDTYKAADGWKDFADYITSNYYILCVQKDLDYRIGNIGASLRAKTGYKGSYTFAEMSKRISDIETYFVDASDEDIIKENLI